LFSGEKAHLLCSYEDPIIGCKFVIPGVVNQIQLAPQQPPFIITESGFKFSYFGNGYERGDCGVTIHNLTFVNHGDAVCTLVISDDMEINETVEIRIKNHPIRTAPKIRILNNDKSLKIGQMLMAECIAGEVDDEFAAISWYLNNEEILSNSSAEQTVKLNGNDDFFEIKSIFKHTLRDADNGKILNCRLDSFLTSSVTSHAELPPLVVLAAASNEMTTRTLPLPKIGEAYDITINFFAFPRPLSPKWKVNERTIYYGKISDEFISQELKYLGNNQWKATLHVTNVTEKNVRFNYTLQVNDADGTKSYYVRLDELLNQGQKSEMLLNHSTNSIVDNREESTSLQLINLDSGSSFKLRKSNTFRRRSTTTTSRINGGRTKIVRKSRQNTTETTTITDTTAIFTVSTVMPTKATIENQTGFIAAINMTHDADVKLKVLNIGDIKKSSMKDFQLHVIATAFILMTVLLFVFLSMVCHYRRQVRLLKTEIIQINMESYYNNQSCLYPPTYNDYSSPAVSDFQRNPLMNLQTLDVKAMMPEYSNQSTNIHHYHSIEEPYHVYDEIISTKVDSLRGDGSEEEKEDEKPNNYENNESMNNNCER
jgi:hypothetical protein